MPSEAWIAYGVVVDEDRDGVPDWRYGIDNLPRTAGDESIPSPGVAHGPRHRSDRVGGGKGYGQYFATGFNSGYPGYADREGL